jgi:hypothetical protein
MGCGEDQKAQKLSQRPTKFHIVCLYSIFLCVFFLNLQISGKPAPEPLKQFKTSAALGSGAAAPVSSVARNKAAPAPVQKPKPTVPTARPNALSGNAERLSTARNTPSEKRAVATPVVRSLFLADYLSLPSRCIYC